MTYKLNVPMRHHTGLLIGVWAMAECALIVLYFTQIENIIAGSLK